jgi:hypothetical protein
MQKLPNEIIDQILYYIDDIRICIELKRYHPLKTKISMDQASKGGYLELVKYLHGIGKECTTDSMNFASKGGHLEVIKYLRTVVRVEFTSKMMGLAAENGHLEVVKYLHVVSKEGNWYSSDRVAEGLYTMRIIKEYYLDEMCIASAMISAARRGYLEIVKYLHSISKECTSEAMNMAVCYGHLEIVKYLHVVGAECTTYAKGRASENGYLEIIKYLHSVGKYRDACGIKLASTNGHLEVVEFLKSIKNRSRYQKILANHVKKIENKSL